MKPRQDRLNRTNQILHLEARKRGDAYRSKRLYSKWLRRYLSYFQSVFTVLYDWVFEEADYYRGDTFEYRDVGASQANRVFFFLDLRIMIVEKLQRVMQYIGLM